MKPLIALALVVLLTGCAGVQTITQQVPVPVPCHAPDVQRPTFPIDTLGFASNVFEVTRALWSTVEMWEAYEVQLRAALDVCK